MKLSIITINYNNLEGLKKTAESVLSQTWRDFEWIIVDGGSTDGSTEYVEELAKILSQETLSLQGSDGDGLPWPTERFFMPGFTVEDLKKVGNPQPTTLYSQPSLFWCSEPDKGIYNAMNKGIVQASGEYLNFMNSGDRFFEKDSISKVFQDITCSVDIIYGNCEYVDNYHSVIKAPTERLSLVWLFDSTIFHQASFIKASLLKCGYDEKYKIISDWKQWVVWFLEGKDFLYKDMCIASFDVNGISNTDSKLVDRERELIWKELLPEVVITEISNNYQHKVETLYYPEINSFLSFIKKRRLYRRILGLCLKAIELIDKVI